MDGTIVRMFQLTKLGDCITRDSVRRIDKTALVCALIGALLEPTGSRAQDAARQVQPALQADQDERTIRLRLPTITVTAQKEPENIQDTPVSVTAVPSQTLESAAVRSVSDAAQYAPNTFF